MGKGIESFTIVGGGFGLYGYLPALFNVFGGGIILPEIYRKIINSRSELKQFEGLIEWVHSTESALLKSAGVVIAITPRAQLQMVQEIFNLDNVKKIIIEKPVAPTIDEAIKIFDNPILERKKIRVGYTFIYANWYPLLMGLVTRSSSAIKIVWNFKADHIAKCKETWKRYHSMGGGVLRFYGIHLIAVLASLGYETVSRCRLEEIITNQPTDWEAAFCGNTLPQCIVSVSINSNNNEFMIIEIDKDGCEKPFYFTSTPFYNDNFIHGQDTRIHLLESLIKTFNYEDYYFNSLYQKINNLWNKVELSSVINR